MDPYNTLVYLPKTIQAAGNDKWGSHLPLWLFRKWFPRVPVRPDQDQPWQASADWSSPDWQIVFQAARIIGGKCNGYVPPKSAFEALNQCMVHQTLQPALDWSDAPSCEYTGSILGDHSSLSAMGRVGILVSHLDQHGDL